MTSVQDRTRWVARALALSLVAALITSCEPEKGACTCRDNSGGTTTDVVSQEKCDQLDETPNLSCSSDLNDHIGRSEILNPFAMTAPTTW